MSYILANDETARNIRNRRQTQHRVPMRCAKWPTKRYSVPWRVGQLSCVREAYNVYGVDSPVVVYRADAHSHAVGRWRPNIHMPRDLARTWVKLGRVWVEQVQDISETDAAAEGVTVTVAHRMASRSFADLRPDLPFVGPAQQAFCDRWDSLYPGAWDRNDWVWACEFECTEAPCAASPASR